MAARTAQQANRAADRLSADSAESIGPDMAEADLVADDID
jgi:hypothetical protein